MSMCRMHAMPYVCVEHFSRWEVSQSRQAKKSKQGSLFLFFSPSALENEHFMLDYITILGREKKRRGGEVKTFFSHLFSFSQG